MVLKVRKNRSPVPPVTCPLTECLEFVAGAWAPEVIWYLRGGARRFSELRLDIPRATAKVLTARLRELEAKGVISRKVIPSSPPTVEYALTSLGEELVPALAGIVSVSEKLKRQGRMPA